MAFAFEARFFREVLDQVQVRPRRLLVVGCGSGDEMAALATETGARCVGLDIDVSAKSRAPGVDLVRADARRLPFRDATFDALYCYHVLEHVPGPEGAVGEARRVLGEGAAAYFGTPNKARLVGYIGGRATRSEKFWWNYHDWRRRLQGKWSNEQGAHAGFTGSELKGLLARSFPRVDSVSLPYYLGKYPGLQGMWRMAFATGLSAILAPSVYFRAMCRGEGRGGSAPR